MIIYFGELIGSAMLIFLGNAGMLQYAKKKDNNLSSKIYTSLVWASAWVIAAYIFGTSSGAHFSPALSIALSIGGSLKVSFLAGYIIMQIVGALIGCILFSFVYMNDLKKINNEDKLICYTNVVKDENLLSYLIKEFVISFVLTFSIKGVSMVWGMAGGLNYFFLFIIILCIGICLGDLSYFAMNPLRDIPCKLIFYISNIKDENKIQINWKYSICTLISMIVASILAILLFKYIPWPSL
ncbi:MAG: aquaporin [Eubacteriales bacterium]|nr:aquaporin [Eubacteriales bacterium]